MLKSYAVYDEHQLQEQAAVRFAKKQAQLFFHCHRIVLISFVHNPMIDTLVDFVAGPTVKETVEGQALDRGTRCL